MKLPPLATQIGREALIVLGGAIVAAALVGHLPILRNWIKRQWE